MPIFTAIATGVAAAAAGFGFGAAAAATIGAVGAFAARTLLTIGITKLIANRSNSTASGTQDSGSRVQLPPATNNKVSVVYGKAYIAPIITDAKISEDQKTMWYVCTMAEVTDTGSYTFGDIYWGGKKMIFDGSDTGKVIQLETNSDPVQTDDKVNGKIYVYRFPNGSASGIDTGASNAITVMSDAAIPADLRWNSALYTDGGQSASMTDLAFMIVKVDYDTNAGTTGLATMNVELTNSLNKPGDVLFDYMTNDRYGCAILAANIDIVSLGVLNTYSDELITYIPTTGGTATQARYRINGPVNTGQNCLSNLQQLVDACDSWLQYSELTGEWTIVVNKPYDWDGTTINDLFLVDSSILITGINVNPIDLNNSYNILEAQYPNTNILDQTDYNVINLVDYVPSVMSYNEPPNQLTVQFPQVNDYIQSTYLGIRRLLQSREDLTVDFTLDYSGIQIQAGDVIRIKFEAYGWDGLEFPEGKLFRVSQVQEAKLDENLGARITAFEYNGTVYYDDPLNDFVPASNTGLTDPNIFDKPSTPVVANGPVANASINYFTVSSNVPAIGTTLYMDFNVGNTSNVETHKSYSSVQVGDGTPYTANSTITINVADLNPATYFWSSTARNLDAGQQSNSSAGFVWGGPSVSNFNANTNVGGIGFAQSGLDGGGAQIVTFYAINNQKTGTVTLPVLASSTIDRDIPLIYTGTAPNVNYIWPYGQGTAVSTYPPAGYGGNSTAPFLPVDAALIAIPFSYTSYDDYYQLISVDLTQTTLTTDEIIVLQAQFQFYTDTPNTRIMIVPYGAFVAGGLVFYLQTQFASFYTLGDVFPYTHTISVNTVDNVEGEAYSVGYFIKVLTTGAQVTCMNGAMATKQQRPYTGSVTL
jgi:hypothetical protein